MEERINRRRFVAVVGAASVLGTAGCIGGGEEPAGEVENDGGGNGGGDGSTEKQGQDEEDGDESTEAFDFPPGADDGGIVTETVVAGSRQIVENTERYRIEQTHELNCSDAPRDEMTFTDEVDGQTVYERLQRDSAEIDHWITPDRTVGRAVDKDTGVTGRWRAESVDSTPVDPFEATSVPSLLESASLEFGGITSDADRPYARYAGEIVGSGIELRQPESARSDYRVESTSGGSVTLDLFENGAIRAVEYEYAGEVTRLTHEGREVVEFEADGHVQFTYDGLESLTRPEWASGQGSDVREFGFTETSLGRTYRLLDGPSLPGTVNQEYAEFYLMAEFDGERYIDRYSPRTEFDSGEGAVADFHESELELDWQSISGRDAFVEADRLEMSIYLYAPGVGRSVLFHEEIDP